MNFKNSHGLIVAIFKIYFLFDLLNQIALYMIYPIVRTVKPRSKAPAYKAMFAYKAFEENPLITFCSTFYIGSKAFSL